MMNRVKSTFPTEVLQTIFSYLTRAGLTQLCQLNHYLLEEYRPLLYKSIDLRSDDKHIQDTLRLLTTNVRLGSKVQSARLQTVPTPFFTNGTWINHTIFEKWPNLKTLTLVGCPFRLAETMRQFQIVLQKSCKFLREITFRPNADMEIAGIIGVQWSGQNTTAELRLNPRFLPHTSSVTRLSFGGRVTHIIHDPLDTIFQQTFTCLISLDLGSLAMCDDPNWSRQRLTQFLTNNPRIQHLSLGKERPVPNVFFDLDPPSLFPAFLPELRSFEGFPENIAVMARAQVQCLDRLQSLVLVSTNGDMEAMFAAFSGRTLASVRHLHVELCKELNHLEMLSNVTFIPHLNDMVPFAHLCPDVTEMFAKIAPIHGGDMLGKMFKRYDHLQSLSLPHYSLFLNMPPNKFEFFHPITQNCTALQFIKTRRPGSQLDDLVFSFVRDDDRNLVEVLEY